MTRCMHTNTLLTVQGYMCSRGGLQWHAHWGESCTCMFEQNPLSLEGVRVTLQRVRRGTRPYLLISSSPNSDHLEWNAKIHGVRGVVCLRRGTPQYCANMHLYSRISPLSTLWGIDLRRACIATSRLISERVIMRSGACCTLCALVTFVSNTIEVGV